MINTILEEIVEGSLRKAGLWEEVKDRLNQAGYRFVGWSATTSYVSHVPLRLRPEVILMDEPCSALDPIATAKVEEPNF